MEITDHNRILRTVLLAERTADTADLAILHGNRSLILGAAGYRILCIIGYEGNQVLRTNLHTLTTRLTCFLIDNGYSVYDMNGVKRTHGYTASKPETTVVAALRTAIRDEGKHPAVLNSCIFIIQCGFVTVSLTGYKCDLPLGFSGFYSHDPGDDLSNSLSTYRAGIDRCFSLCDCCSEPAAAGESASATVISGKGCKYSLFLFIYFYLKPDNSSTGNNGSTGGNSEKDTNKKTDSANNCYC